MHQDLGVMRKMGHVQRCFFDGMRARAGNNLLQPSQGPIMGMLSHHDGMSQCQLAQKMNVSPATVAISLNRLEKQGMIQRRRDEQNRRMNLLFLTEAGRKEAAGMLQCIQDTERIAMAGFTKAEAAQMEAYLDRILKNLQSDHATKGKEGMEQNAENV